MAKTRNAAADGAELEADGVDRVDRAQSVWRGGVKYDKLQSVLE